MSKQHVDNDWWIAMLSLNDESRHIMILRSGPNKSLVESAIDDYLKSHNSLYPHLPLKLLKLDRWESIEQHDAWRGEIRNWNPTQKFADELFPDNPNLLLFANPERTQFGPGEAGEAALIDYLCSGGM